MEATSFRMLERRPKTYQTTSRMFSKHVFPLSSCGLCVVCDAPLARYPPQATLPEIVNTRGLTSRPFQGRSRTCRDFPRTSKGLPRPSKGFRKACKTSQGRPRTSKDASKTKPRPYKGCQPFAEHCPKASEGFHGVPRHAKVAQAPSTGFQRPAKTL